MRSVYISCVRADDSTLLDEMRRCLIFSGFEVFDGIEQREQSPESVLVAIRRADVVLAIVNDKPPNVLFELGFALGLGKPVLLIADSTEELPADLAGFITIRAGHSSRDLGLDVVYHIEALGLPVEALDIRQESATTLLRTFHSVPERFEAMDPRQFEGVVAEAYREMGYQIQPLVGPGDRGIDILMSDPIGKLVAVQVKKKMPQRKVSVAEINELIDAAMLSGASKGIVVTTSSFTTSARDLVERSPLELELVTVEELINEIGKRSSAGLGLAQLAREWLLKTPADHGSWASVWQSLWQNAPCDPELERLAREWLAGVPAEHGSWAFVWQTLWQASPLDPELERLAREWLARVPAEYGSWAYVWQALWQTSPLDPELERLAREWLACVPTEHGSWAFIWVPLWQASPHDPELERLAREWLARVPAEHGSWAFIWVPLWKASPHDPELERLAREWLAHAPSEHGSWILVSQSLMTMTS